MLNVLLLLLWRFLPPRLHSFSLQKRVAFMIGISLILWGSAAIGIGFLIQYMLYIKVSIKIIGGAAIGVTAIIWLIVALCGRNVGMFITNCIA